MAVDNISFDIEKGDIVGFLGPNGAGKTTTLTMLLGITKPTQGEVKIFDLNFKENREKILKKVNYASAYSFFQGRITVHENLNVFCLSLRSEKPKRKNRKLLKDFELTDLRNQLAGTLSSGQLTRLSLCKSLLNDLELLFLDEPTA